MGYYCSHFMSKDINLVKTWVIMFPQDVLLCKALKHEYSAQIYEYLLKVLTPRLLIDCFDLLVELYT